MPLKDWLPSAAEREYRHLGRPVIALIISMVPVMAILMFVGLLVVAAAPYLSLRTMPKCEQSAVLVGAGDFVAGRWSSYECGPGP